MALRPEERKRQLPEEAPAAVEPIRWPVEENKDWYSDLVEHSQDLLCVHDLEGRILSVNTGPARLLGYSMEEVLSKRLQDIVDPQCRDQCDAYLSEIARTGECRGLAVVMTRTGERRIWEYHNTLRSDGVAAPVVRAIAHDVTERVQAEKALRESNEKLLNTAREQERTVRELTLFRTLLDQSNDAIEILEPKTLRFLDVNERACADLGYSREKLLSMTVFDITPGLDTNERARVEQQLRESGFVIMEKTRRRKDGTIFPVEVNLRAVQVDRKYAIAVVRDITARKRAERQLREFERVVENLEEMVAVVDRDYRFVIANQAFLRHWGMTKEQVIGHFAEEVTNPEFFESVIKKRLDECFRGKVVKYERRNNFPGMGERDLAVTYLPVEGPAGIDRAACIFHDITEQKRAEAASRESEERERARAKELETILEVVPVPVMIVHDSACRRMTGNRAAHEQRRVPVGKNLSKSAPPDERPAYRMMENGAEVPADLLPMQQAAATGKPVYGRALKIVFEDGSERETVVDAVPLLDERGMVRGAVGSSIDLTEQKQTERALRESELRFRTVYEKSPVGIALVESRSGRYLQANPKFCEITGRTEEELLRSDMASITHPDDVEACLKRMHKLAEDEGRSTSYEVEKRYLRPDGSVCRAKVLIVPMWGDGETRRWHMVLAK
ncbi:MAG: PAS domain S-box protein, partial [Terriglobales bacterium]